MESDNGKEIEAVKPKGKAGRPVGTKGIIKIKPNYRRFVREYFKCGCHAVEAARAAFKDEHRETRAVSRANKFMKRPEVKQEIARIMELEKGMHPDAIKLEITKLAFMQPDDPWTEISGGVGLKKDAIDKVAKITGVIDSDNKAMQNQQPLLNLLVSAPEGDVKIQSVIGIPANGNQNDNANDNAEVNPDTDSEEQAADIQE